MNAGDTSSWITMCGRNRGRCSGRNEDRRGIRSTLGRPSQYSANCRDRSSVSAMPRKASATLRTIAPARSEEHTSELQSLMRISYAVFCLKKKNNLHPHTCAPLIHSCTEYAKTQVTLAQT